MLTRYRKVRDFTHELCGSLKPEDCVVQSMPDVSPTKWHLAHTSWFFETFLLKPWMPSYQSEVPEYAFLFNSYYNAAGDMHRRDLRGLISRPTVDETYRYRRTIDDAVAQLLQSADDERLAAIEPVMTLGIQHEQQHQELLVTDIKHVLAQNPLHPIYQPDGRPRPRRAPVANDSEVGVPRFIDFDEATVEIGHDGSGFSYDNEAPRHRALVLPFALATRLSTNRDYIEFMEDGGYARSEFWLSLGWTTVNEQRWEAPMYWTKRDGAWLNFTLAGFRPVDLDEPVTHVSYFEADAFANWAGARLPTEFEWERAAADLPIEGNFVDARNFHPVAANRTDERRVVPGSEDGTAPVAPAKFEQMFGDVWQWTRSSYSPYPGYRAAPGALGEYNGKFMCNQYVLRGGSCATSRSHIRRTYRNFFQPEKRWQFTGIRLARDAK
ncbi:MAG: ergothioneine biosynthesis protein EgtB [Chthoniobacterales bacterium]